MTVPAATKLEEAVTAIQEGAPPDCVAGVWAGSGLWRVPPMPGSLRLLLVSDVRDGLDVEKVARVVSMDEILASHTLRLANSAALGFRSPVQSIEQAIARLGCGTVRSMALALTLSRDLSLPLEVGGIARLKVWAHNWAVARAAAILSPQYGLKRGEAHLCGLLHDVGKLVWAACKPERYRLCVAQAAEEQVELARLERTLMGLSHSGVGEATLQAWGLPKGVVESAAEHHRPWVGSPVSAAGRLVRAANALAHAAGIGLSGNPSPPDVADCLANDRNLTRAAVERCMNLLEEERTAIEEMALQLGADPSNL